MIIECEGCGTRFNLADAQVPAEGARVRCSKCHHRFHVMPLGNSEPDEEPQELGGELVEQDQADISDWNEPPTAWGAQAEPAAPAPVPAPEPEPAPVREVAKPSRPRAQGDDPDLENPEFLFDQPDEDDDAGDFLGGGEGQSPELASADSTHDTGLGSGSGAPGGLGPAGPGGGGDLSAPEAAPVGPPLAEQATAAVPPEDGGDVRSQVFGLAPGENLDGSAAEEKPDGWDGDLLRGSDQGADIKTGGEPDTSWADLNGEPGADSDVAAPDPDRSVAVPGRRRLPHAPAAEAPSMRIGSHPASTALVAAAFAIGLLLVTGGLRLVVTHGTGTPRGPQVVRAAGWIATEVDARHLRDALGRRVLVLRGNLLPEGQGPPPGLDATLLDASGFAVEAPVIAVLERLEGVALSPPALTARLEEGSVRRPRRPVTGFTLLVPEPPGHARRFRLDLLPSSGGV